MYKNRNGALFIPVSEDSENITGICITIAENIHGRYHGHLIISYYTSDKTAFNWVYVKTENDEDHRNVIDLIFSVMISDERRA